MIVCEHCLEVRQINPLLDDDDCIAEPDGFGNLRAALGFKRRQFARAIEKVQDARPLALLIAPGRALPDLDNYATAITTPTPTHPRPVVSQHANIVSNTDRVMWELTFEHTTKAKGREENERHR